MPRYLHLKIGTYYCADVKLLDTYVLGLNEKIKILCLPSNSRIKLPFIF